MKVEVVIPEKFMGDISGHLSSRRGQIESMEDRPGLKVINAMPDGTAKSFLDSARDESLEAIGEALAENGRVIVTGCLGAEAALITNAHPKVLAVTGPHQYEAVMDAVHTHLLERTRRVHAPGSRNVQVAAPVPDRAALPSLTAQVAANNFYAADPESDRAMRFAWSLTSICRSW